MRIDVIEHSKYIMSVAMRYRKEFPSISLADIIQELNLLVIEMSEKEYDTKYKVTTFIENFPAKKLRQVLIYKYVNFTYKDKERIFIESCSVDSKVTDLLDSPEYIDSLKLVEASQAEYSCIAESDVGEYEVIDLIEKSNLSDIEKNIMYRRLGINNFKVMTLEEIGKEFKITREWVRKIEAKAKEKLKKNILKAKIYGEREDIEISEEVLDID
jgi:RNA polymerase sigma factor (sigma-70 family)